MLNPNTGSNSGAILNWGHLYITKSIIKENNGVEGGGIFNMNDMIIKDVTIDSNQDYLDPIPSSAGIFNWGTANLTNTTISFNGWRYPNIPGDGVFNGTPGHMEITNSTISHNAGCGIDNEGDLAQTMSPLRSTKPARLARMVIFTPQTPFSSGSVQ
jgi:hypothetical protein